VSQKQKKSGRCEDKKERGGKNGPKFKATDLRGELEH